MSDCGKDARLSFFFQVEGLCEAHREDCKRALMEACQKAFKEWMEREGFASTSEEDWAPPIARGPDTVQ
jgi:hypothetical protein